MRCYIRWFVGAMTVWSNGGGDLVQVLVDWL